MPENVVRWVFALFLTIVPLFVFTPANPVSAQAVSCSDFDAWVWAQTVYETDPASYGAALDPDGNAVACENLTIDGFAPILWTDSIPSSAVPAQVTSITDGDTFHVTVDGAPDTIRMYHMDTPEKEACGAAAATNYLSFVLQYAPGGTVYLEYDKTQRDRYDRRLAYVWYELGGDVYMVNEVMVRNGWAASETFKPDDKYKTELDAAEQFSIYHVLGVRLECGKFKQPPGSQPSNQQLREAQQRQPNQGQFPAPAPPSDSGGSSQVPVPTQAPAPAPQGNCDPSYPSVCIPPRSQVGDLDCGDITFRRFTVLPPDPHNFDGDFDGVGCESG